MDQRTQFTSGPIVPKLIGFALPVLLALCLQSLCGAVDLLIVGQFNAEADVSAVATGSQMMHMVTVVLTGLAMGTTVLLGQAIGNGRRDQAGSIIGSSICLFAVLALVFTGVMMALARPFATLMHAPPEAFEKTVQYVQICSAGTVFIIAYNVLGSVFRGIGDSRTPLLSVLFASIFNIIGDLLFVALLDMKAAGAALATVLAQAFSVIICILIVRRRTLPFDLTRKHLRFERALTLQVVRTGLPIALQDGLVNVSFLAIGAIVNSLGVVASAGVGVAEKICAFIMLVPSAFSQSLSAFVAQNIGAGLPQRARKATFYGMMASLAVGVVMGYLSFFHGDMLARIFSAQPEVIAAAADYLRSYAIDTLFVSFLFCFIGYFSGCGKTTFVMVQGIVGAFGVRVPVSYLMSRIAGVSLFQIGLATPASTIVQITLCVVYLLLMLKKEKQASAIS